MGVKIMKKTEWIRCPVCGNKTRLQIREDTELKNFPLYCPKCKQESLIEAKAKKDKAQRGHRIQSVCFNLPPAFINSYSVCDT